MTPDSSQVAPTRVPVEDDLSLEDWSGVLSDLGRGDALAVAKVSRVISAFMMRFRAYELRDSWEDLRQEVLETLIRAHRRGALRHPDALVTYAGRVVWSRLVVCMQPRDPSELAAEPAPVSMDPDLLLDLERALGALPGRERAVTEAIYLRGMDDEAAAEALELPLTTLRRLQAAALRALRQVMGVSAKRRMRADRESAL